MATSTYPLTALARTTDPTAMLRRFLGLDAVVTAGNGAAYAAVSGPLGDFLGVDSGLLLGLGAGLVLYGIGVAFLAARKSPPPFAVQAVVEVNAVWAVLSVVALVAWLSPSTAGAVWIPLQAATVGGFAALQYAALRAVRAGRQGLPRP
ncbi:MULTISPECIES: hypothetical protein [Streptomyces]|uniref:Integral membrane protein n=1 Tax=Streptomyces venezuelae TaxID=54571 RepID=A0A5P2BL77_STRVZ|nr:MULTISPECIES: hypothetical protein [Streptomyces]NEA04849.1 hypothetical protein [Streptomyces sp. SID10116]MYY80739.1 hypothetical protein [Streptomyces sp. SID335]MYZ14668.1 hypothetical protein [Streptomyces sp. SID337]NDZ91319.1 hypothetical protein [Streptomyces sp. SID10115]NEB50211.1 hypothetical protein [Streptomyces sp. SID339]